MAIRIHFRPTCFVVLLVSVFLCLIPGATQAQEKKAGDIILPEVGSGSVDAYIEALKSDIGKETRRIVEVNLPLSEKEAALFWPIYNRYAYDLDKLNYEKAQQFDFYAANYKTLSDKQAEHLLKQLGSIERRELLLEEKYVREMAKELPAKTVLRFVQISRQVERLVTLRIMSGMPLIPKGDTGSKKEGPKQDKP